MLEWQTDKQLQVFSGNTDLFLCSSLEEKVDTGLPLRSSLGQDALTLSDLSLTEACSGCQHFLCALPVCRLASVASILI